MKANFRIARSERTLYGASAHYWPPQLLPLLVAGACIEIVLQNSDKASVIYREIKDAWGKKGCQLALSEVRLPFKDMLEVAGGNNEVGMRLWAELLEVYERHKDGADCQYLIGHVNEFVKVGFNREVDKADCKYKVIPSNAFWLCFAIGWRALVDFSEERADWETLKLVEFEGEKYDLTKVMDGVYSNRLHRRHVSYYRGFGWRLNHDTKLKQIAWRWYQCRVVCSSIDEFCDKQSFEGKLLDSKNIDKEIQVCDEVTGYIKRKRKQMDE